MESCTQVLPLGQPPGPDIVSAEPEITVHEAVILLELTQMLPMLTQEFTWV